MEKTNEREDKFIDDILKIVEDFCKEEATLLGGNLRATQVVISVFIGYALTLSNEVYKNLGVENSREASLEKLIEGMQLMSERFEEKTKKTKKIVDFLN